MERFSREDVLQRPGRCDHAAHLYVESDSLCEAVHWYVAGALDRGEAALIVADAPHTAAVLRRLRTRWDIAALTAAGQLRSLDARAVLEKVMRGDQPDRSAFDALLIEQIERVRQRFDVLRVYGELVDLLWQRQNQHAADLLEQWWNDLIARYRFSLLCGYRVDVLDARGQADLQKICPAHTHVIPSADCDRLERALDAALRQVFPDGEVEALRRFLEKRRGGRRVRMPAAQHALLALHEVMPLLAQDVRMRAWDHYRRLIRDAGSDHVSPSHDAAPRLSEPYAIPRLSER